jgi:hypothetical protein
MRAVVRGKSPFHCASPVFEYMDVLGSGRIILEYYRVAVINFVCNKNPWEPATGTVKPKNRNPFERAMVTKLAIGLGDCTCRELVDEAPLAGSVGQVPLWRCAIRTVVKDHVDV